jgi:hypothetical protein
MFGYPLDSAEAFRHWVSTDAIGLAGRCGAPALLDDVFPPLLGIGCWQTVLLIDGKVGLGVDPRRIPAGAAAAAV